MKKKYLIAIIVGLVSGLHADVGTNGISARLAAVRDSGDLNSIVASLPEAETLWSQKPKDYFLFMQRAAFRLNGASMTDKEAASTAWGIFTNVLSKPVSTNYEIALDSLEPQVDVVESSHWVLRRTNNEKSGLLLIAQFIGKISDQIIPNYPNTEMMISGGTPQEVAANEITNLKISWQMSLVDNRRRLFNLLFLSYTDRTDTNFNEQLISAAHMTDAEAHELRSGARSPRAAWIPPSH